MDFCAKKREFLIKSLEFFFKVKKYKRRENDFMEEIILETKELCKQYHKQTVLKNINMRIPKGCIYGLLGANGAGKSTLMKILCGMTRADAGEVLFDGKMWSRKCIERMGILIELPPVYENLSAVDNLKVRTWTLGIPDARIQEVLDIVDLKNTGKKQAGKFSMGMKQRLGIAVALLNDPDFLILDVNWGKGFGCV